MLGGGELRGWRHQGGGDGCCLSHGYRLLLELWDGKSVSILCRKKNLLGDDLLKDKNRSIGRYDARFTGIRLKPETNDAREFDPSAKPFSVPLHRLSTITCGAI